MPKRQFIILMVSVITAAALTVWVATSVTGGVSWWLMAVPLALAVLARVIWMRGDPR